MYQNVYYNSETYTAYKTRGFYQNLKISILMTPYKSLLTQVKNKKAYKLQPSVQIGHSYVQLNIIT